MRRGVEGGAELEGKGALFRIFIPSTCLWVDRGLKAQQRVVQVGKGRWERTLGLVVVRELILDILQIAHLLLVVAVEARLPGRTDNEEPDGNGHHDKQGGGPLDYERSPRVLRPVVMEVGEVVEEGTARN